MKSFLSFVLYTILKLYTIIKDKDNKCDNISIIISVILISVVQKLFSFSFYGFKKYTLV